MMEIALNPKLLDKDWVVEKIQSVPRWFLDECMDELEGFSDRWTMLINGKEMPDIGQREMYWLRPFFAMWERVPTWDDPVEIEGWKKEILLELLEGSVVYDDKVIMSGEGCGDCYDCVWDSFPELRAFNERLEISPSNKIEIFKDELNKYF